jgi:3-methyl-2-oxobutanoate hydroxymethyltransferase
MALKPLTVNDFGVMKREGVRIAALTAYDALFARLLDESGIDLILVGDSLANVFQGRETTIPVTLDQMIYHGEIVARTVRRAFVVVDMPFMSFQVGDEDALRNAGRIMKETGCKGVKIEGGVTRKQTMRRIIDAGIPVLGHVGLTPQSVNAFGGFGIQGRENRETVIADARAVEESGAFAVVLEKIPRALAAELTAMLSIPTIGIGAGPGCDGQIIVTPDMLGLFTGFKARFVRRYAELGKIGGEAFSRYIADVRSGGFPSDEESYTES